MNIYVGNLSFDETEASLESAFAAHGEVTSARIITDRETGRSRGFGFVEMGDQSQAQAAIAALNGTCPAITSTRSRPVIEVPPNFSTRKGGEVELMISRFSGPRILPGAHSKKKRSRP